MVLLKMRESPAVLKSKVWILMCSLGWATSAAWSQAKYTAQKLADVQVGGEVTGVDSRYEPTDTDGNPASLEVLNFKSKFLGGGVYANFDWRSHYGAALDIRHLVAHSGDSSTQTTYAIGGRYMPIHEYGFTPYAKLQFGRGVYNYPHDLANLGFNILVYGGGVDYRLMRGINLRAEYEFQQWFDVPLRSPNPNVGSIGVAYHFHGGKLEGR